MTINEQIRDYAKKMLEGGEVKQFIGFEKGRLPFHSTPVFITKPGQVERLIWDDYCIANLSKYLVSFSHEEGKTALVVKGCDSRGIVRLIQDHQLQREKLVLIGIPCQGMKDSLRFFSNGENSLMAPGEKCQSCTHPNPVLYDILIGEEVKPMNKDRFKKTEEIENLDINERYLYWSREFAHCIRCYACRNVCPACSCLSCYLDQHRVEWHGKDPAENASYLLTRAIHVAGRCIECGECARVCPAGVSVMELNKKLIKDINELFGEQDAGVDFSGTHPLCQYHTDDPDDFQ
jgi:formate dehydrogenase (coenzyme F420) beta subunit